MRMGPDNIQPAHPLGLTPACSLKIRCQVCDGYDEALAGGLAPGEAAATIAQFVGDFEQRHRACWGPRL